MLNYRVAYASSGAAARSLADYFEREALRQTPEQERYARYLGGEAPPLSPVESLGKAVAEGEIAYSEALDGLLHEALQQPETQPSPKTSGPRS